MMSDVLFGKELHAMHLRALCSLIAGDSRATGNAACDTECFAAVEADMFPGDSGKYDENQADEAEHPATQPDDPDCASFLGSMEPWSVSIKTFSWFYASRSLNTS